MEGSPSQGTLAHSSSFQQQGTIDWTQLATKLVGYSLDVLSRFSAANVDPYTIEVGKIVASDFQLSARGRNNVSDALANLHSYRSFGDALWFGFGIRHIVRSIATTENGFTCLTLCGALAEFYHENIAVEILFEFAKSLKAPPQFTPSLMQWRALLRSCAGVFATSHFGVLAEQYARRNPYANANPHAFMGNPEKPYDGYATPTTIAETLRGIASVSRGEMAKIVIVGGNDVGFLAAFCDYFLGLSVEVKTSSDDLLYTTNDRDTQIVFLFKRPEMPPDAHLTDSLQLQSVQKTYILGDWGHLIRPSESSSISVASGRVPWDCLFSTVFGQDFEILLEQHDQCIGEAIGSAARILFGISQEHDEIRREILSNWQAYSSTTYGKGFIDFVVTIFPELAIMKSNMLSAAQKSFSGAKLVYETQINTLIHSCGCKFCTKYKDDDEDPERFCLVAIFETILKLALHLADVSIADKIFPKRSAIRERYYDHLRELRLDLHTPQRIPFSSESIGGPFTRVIWEILSRSHSRSRSRSHSRIQNCIRIFTGYSQATHEEEAAVARAGICVYLDSLVQGPSDDVETFNKLIIIPGTIEFHDRPYTTMYDSPLLMDFEPKWLRFASEYRKSTLYLSETLDGLRCHFELSTDLPSKYPSIPIGPQDLIQMVKKARGWAKCKGGQCQKITDVPAGANVEVEFLGNNAHIVTGDTITRCVAYCIAEKLEYVYLTKDEACVQCVLKVGMSGGLKHHFSPGLQNVGDTNRFVIVGA